MECGSSTYILKIYENDMSFQSFLFFQIIYLMIYICSAFYQCSDIISFISSNTRDVETKSWIEKDLNKLYVDFTSMVFLQMNPEHWHWPHSEPEFLQFCQILET